MLNSLPVRLLWHSLNWLTRWALTAAALGAGLIALIIIVMRYWILPDVELYHDRIEQSLASAIGNPVTIGRIEGDWQGFQPRLNFSEVVILDRQRKPALVLPRIGGSLSWLSLFSAELRLATLELDRPVLRLRRDRQGKLFVGGVELSGGEGGNDSLADWLLHQSRIVVRNANIVWLDDSRAARPLELNQVNLRIENFFNRHRFALRALPPAELSTPLDVRGDFTGQSFDDLAAWQGRLYTRLDYTDVSAWRPWLNLPQEFSRGSGAIRGWLGVAHGHLNEIIADVDLHGVSTRLAADVPELELNQMHGRAIWKENDGDLQISTNGLSIRLQNGIMVPPTDFSLRLTDGKNNPLGGELRANMLQLETLTSMAVFVPLTADLRSQLANYAPQGRVSGLNLRWTGSLEQPSEYRIKGKFENMALRATTAWPGFAGLTFDVDGNESGGRLIVDSRHLTVDAPDDLVEPLKFTRVAGQGSWGQERGELVVRVDNAAITNEDIAGNLYGSFRTRKETLGVLDLTVALTRGDLTKAYRYTPLIALDKPDNDWLKSALLAGHTDDFRVRIKGNLADFPLDGRKDALLEIGGHAKNVVLAYDKAWPRVENISGEFWIRGNKLEAKAPAATMLGAKLHGLSVAIPDLMSEDLPLEIKGIAQAPTTTFLQFVQQSPVHGYINGVTDGMQANGDAELDLSARIPLQGEQTVKVAGVLHLQGNDIDIGGGAPLLRNTRGDLTFSESGMQADKVSSEILGGGASISLSSGEGGMLHATARGHCDLDALRKINPQPALQRLRGGANWEAELKVVNQSAELTIDSNLQGIASSLPIPFAKRAVDALPLHVEKRIVAEGQDSFEIQLGKLLNARLMRREDNGVMTVRRGVIGFGPPIDAAKWLKKDGIWLVGRLPQLALQGWGNLLDGAGSGGSFPIGGMELHIDRIADFGPRIENLDVSAIAHGDTLSARLSSAAMTGDAEWLPRDGGKLTLRLDKLDWVGSPPAATSVSRSVTTQDDLEPTSLPTLQFSVENLRIDGKQIGRFELVGHPEGKDWRLRRFNVVNPDGSLSGDGIWHGDDKSPRTEVNLLLQISDVGKILERSGFPDTVKGGSGKLSANLSWSGAPQDFEFTTLNGTLRLDAGNGQFLKMKPGMGKLLSVLSLQSLPKRITLDFTDVFSEGFEFDSIKGNATVKAGVIQTQNFGIEGTSAKVSMKGSVDLTRETQDLRVVVLPTLGDSVSVLGAFAAGPAVGIGALVVNKVLGDPLDKLVSFEYNISGSWTNPSVAKVGQATARTNNQE